MEICAEGIMDTKNHQRRNFEKDGNTERTHAKNIQKSTTFRGSYRKKGLESLCMIGIMNSRRKRSPKEELYISFN